MSMAGPAYCSVSDVITAMTSYNAAGTPGEISSTIVTLAVNQASAKVSSWTFQEWGTDQSGNAVPVPDIIQSITINIAAYYATLSYRKNKPLENNDPVVLRYNDAITELKAIQQGQINPDPNAPNEMFNAPGTIRNVRPRIFTPQDSGTTIERGRVEPSTYPSAGSLNPPWL